MKTHRIIINNQQLTYYTSDVFSIERPTVFLHGWGSTGLVFQPVLNQIENWLALDWPGFGQSELPHDDWYLDNYVDVLHQFLQALNVNTPTLIGHSFGGSVIIRFCATHPNNFPIVLVGSAGVRQKSFFIRSKAALAKSVKIASGILPRALRHKVIAAGVHLGSTDYRNAGPLKKTMAHVLSQDVRVDMPLVGNRVTLIWGAEDMDTPLADAKIMQRLLPHAELLSIPNAGHYCFLDNTPVFLDYLKSSLK